MKKLSKDILYSEFVLSNKSAREIATEYGVSPRAMSSWIKSYNLKKLYTEESWLKSEFISKNKSLSEISIENNIPKSTLSRWVSKFNLKKKEDYKDKDWLIKRYLGDNKSASEIALECGVSGESIRFWIKKYSIVKDRKSKAEKFSETMNSRYGKIWPCRSELSKRKRVETLVYKGASYLYNIDGTDKTLRVISDEYKVPYSTLTGWVNNGKIIDNNSLISHLECWKSGATSLESYFSNLYGIDIFNQKIKSSGLRYRPDFKLNNKIYLNVDGLYWHSEANTYSKFDKNYHFNMRKEFEDNNLRIIQFRADEIIGKQELIKSMVDAVSKKIESKIFARKCLVKRIGQSEANTFYKENHLMSAIKARHIGLTFENNLVCLLSIKEFEDRIKIERFSSKTNTIVIGGFSKLLKKIKTGKSIHYWVDLRYGTGSFLLDRGFRHERDTLGWKWTDLKETYNRLACRANMDSRKMSEKAYAMELKWYKIYDAGQRLYILE